MNPNVSIVISTFNSESWLRACLQQLSSQTIIEKCEIIVIDSGSEQNESYVCRELLSVLSCLAYERTARETLYAAWNRGLAKARGRYFVNVNTDDALAPDALECFVRAMDNNLDVALAYADCVWSPTPNASPPWPDSWKRVRYTPYAAEMALFYCFTSCTQFWRTSALKGLGGFDPELKAAGDFEILGRVVSCGMKALHIPRPLTAFYQNTKGISQASSAANDEFLSVRSRFRREVDLAKVFPVNMSDQIDRRGAHLTLALRSLKAHIPWHDEPVPDVDYAVENLLAAAGLSSSLRGALLKLSASMVARGALGNAVCHKVARLLLSPAGLFLLHGKPLAAKL